MNAMDMNRTDSWLSDLRLQRAALADLADGAPNVEAARVGYLTAMRDSAEQLREELDRLVRIYATGLGTT